MNRALILLLALLPAAACSRVTEPQLPYYESGDFTPKWTGSTHHVGSFRLTTQTGAPLTDRDLAGRVHVASFIYTRCTSICPTLVSNLKRVQDAIADPDVLVVSYSVTPELDSPAVLAAFGKDRGINPGRWKLVTGDRRQIYALARDAYFASDERAPSAAGDAEALLHTEKLVLVDRSGKLRGVYNGMQPFDVEHLIEDAKLLAAS